MVEILGTRQKPGGLFRSDIASMLGSNMRGRVLQEAFELLEALPNVSVRREGRATRYTLVG